MLHATPQAKLVRILPQRKGNTGCHASLVRIFPAKKRTKLATGASTVSSVVGT